MEAAAVICEYNPFHNGHSAQFLHIREKAGADTAILCLMSGCFVQRGEPAVIAPMLRAEAALRSGADLVLENPITNVLRSAEQYALGSVKLLEALGGIDWLSFGAESGSAEAFLNLAALLRSEAFSQALRPQLDLGISFPAARQRAVEKLGYDGSLLEKPNCILGIEYCKALLETGSTIRPMVIYRPGDYHDSVLRAEAPSATAVRNSMLENEQFDPFVPESAVGLYHEANLHAWRYGERAVLAVLRTMKRESFQKTAHGEEGLWSRIARISRESPDIEGILSQVKAKRYTRTRVQRLMTCAFLQIEEKLLKQEAPYVRVLGFSERGRELLHSLKQRSRIPLVNAGAIPPDREYLKLEERCADLYELCGRQKPEYGSVRRWRTLIIGQDQQKTNF